MTYKIETTEHTNCEGKKEYLVYISGTNELGRVSLSAKAEYNEGEIFYSSIKEGSISAKMLPELEKAIMDKINEVPLPDITKLSLHQLVELKGKVSDTIEILRRHLIRGNDYATDLGRNCRLTSIKLTT